MTDDLTRNIILGLCVGYAVLLVVAALKKPVSCTECGHTQPKFRIPATIRQALFGGFTCKGCGTELNMQGRRRDG